jgi:acid phosphatase type 7
MKLTYRIALILAALGLLSGALAPAFASTTTLTAEADSFVLSSSPTAKRGRVQLLKINDDVKRSYFRFNLSGLPAGETITQATLRIFATTKPKCSLGAEILRAATETWAESTITWNNQPGTTGSTVTSVASWTANSYVTFDVTRRTAEQPAVSAGSGRTPTAARSTRAVPLAD